MRFPKSFSRFKGTVPAGAIALGGDGAAPTAPPGSYDNVMVSRFSNTNGWPCHRVAVVYKAPSGVLALSATMWFWEDNLQAWFQIGDPQNLTPGKVAFFDVVALLDVPHVAADMNSVTAGSIAQALVVADSGGAPNGEHKFAVGPDLTTSP